MGLLQPKQDLVFKEVLSNPAIKKICLYGSSRSGKTFLTADYNLERAIAYPGSFHLYVRATLTALTTGVVTQTFPNLFRAYEKETGIDITTARTDKGMPFIEHRSNPYNRYTLYNGSEIRFIGLDTQSTNKSALDKVLSQEYLTITVEEGPEVDFSVIEMLLTRLAQRVNHYKTGKPGIPKLLVTLNPRLFEDWDYVYFQKKINPSDGNFLPRPEEVTAVHFELSDNIGNVSDDYLDILKGLSTQNQLRFLEGKHGDSFEGEIFKKLNWETLPDINEFDTILIYTDPSYKSGVKNDFKASMTIGRRNGAYWVIDGRAMQCTTSQMVLNVSDLYTALLNRNWRRPVAFWFENAGMPDDFDEAIHQHALSTGWACPHQKDNRVKGDKFARIESALEPLNRDGKLFFNRELKEQRIGNLITVQFLNFRKNMLKTEHDDIPDAVHGGVTLINLPTIQPGGTRVIDKMKGPTF